MKALAALSVFGLWALTACPSGVLAQPKSAVHDLTDQEVTSDKLIETLTPHEPVRRSRGIGAVNPAAVSVPTKPQCQTYQQQRSRGIAPAETAPVSDAAAIHVEFASNSAELAPQAAQTLDKLAVALKSENLSSYCFQIEGHTDGKGSDPYNLKLSERRARSVVRYLSEHDGIDAERLVAIGYGKRKPIADNSTEEGRQKNRRVQVVNLGSGPAAAQ